MKRQPTLAIAFALACVVAGASSAQPSFFPHPFYQRHNLVSDGSIAADHTDPNLVNPWGVVFNPFGFVWVANNHSGTSTLYDGAGVAQSLVVQNGAASGASKFIFATEDGTISGWAPTADPTHALIAVDNSASGAIYKGL